MQLNSPPFWILLLVVIELFGTNQQAHAQTYQFSQYYNTFQLLNPSYTGISGHQYRVGMISRVQWLGVPSQPVIPYTTSALYGNWVFEHPVSKDPNMKRHENARNSFYSAGFALLQNNQASGQLKTTTAIASVSWIGRLGESTYLAGGTEFNYTIMKLGEYIPVIDYLQGINTPVPGDQVQYPNFSIGLTLVLKKMWLGASLKDVLSTPVGTSIYTQDKKYYDQLNVHGGFSTQLMGTEKLLMTSSFSLKTWKELKQLEAGLGIVRAYRGGYSWSTSFAYRGFPIQTENLSNSDALIFILGFNSIPIGSENEGKKNLLGNSSITISSDFYSFQFGSSFSTWEVSLIFHTPYKKERIVRCEDYLHGPMAEQITRNFYSGNAPYASTKSAKKGNPNIRTKTKRELEGDKNKPKTMLDKRSKKKRRN